MLKRLLAAGFLSLTLAISPQVRADASPLDGMWLMARMMYGMMKGWEAFVGSGTGDFDTNMGFSMPTWLSMSTMGLNNPMGWGGPGSFGNPWSSFSGPGGWSNPWSGPSGWNNPGWGNNGPWQSGWQQPGPWAGGPGGYGPGPGYGPPRSPLEGTWLARDGSGIQIAGQEMILLAGGQPATRGRYRQQGNQLVTWYPQLNSAQWYEFDMQQGLLALRNQQGNVMLLQRVEPVYGW